MPPGGDSQERIIIALAICRLFLAIFGCAANVIAAVVLTNRKLWSPTSMLLLSLVIYDAFYLLLVIPTSAASISITVQFTAAKFSSYRTILALCFPLRYIAQMASTYTTMTVTVERFLVILLPLKANSIWTRGKTRRAIIVVLVFSVVFNIPRCFDHILATRADSMSPSSSIPSTQSALKLNTSASSYSPDPACSDGVVLADIPPGCARNRTCSYARRTEKEGGGSGAGSRLNLTSNLSPVAGDRDGPSSSTEGRSSQTTRNSQNASDPAGDEVSKGDPDDGGGSEEGDDGVSYFYTNVYQYYLTPIFLYLIPYTVIPILNLQLLIALKRRKEETRRISVKHEHRLNGTNGGPSPTDKEEGLTYIVLGITFCYFICCILPTVYMITAIAKSTSDQSTSILIFNAGETTLVINASTDFFFYCLLGRKFRRVFVRTFCPKRYLKKTKAMTLRSTVSYNSV
ncbi:hypothetical protein BaRGS_00009789 [Batillaria attramentaria]|uniref:G-protein coupled receptors family 1 profile domain-containing protein n=1 Tax=Batillaria attramentaria TaxID=370345 RepID=A0ABD0LHL9_9CAEN